MKRKVVAGFLFVASCLWRYLLSDNHGAARLVPLLVMGVTGAGVAVMIQWNSRDRWKTFLGVFAAIVALAAAVLALPQLVTGDGSAGSPISHQTPSGVLARTFRGRI